MTGQGLDANGQPLRAFPLNALNNQRKSIDQLVGLCRGILADGVVNQAEAYAFKEWMKLDHKFEWPIGEIQKRVQRVFDDGLVDQAELDELRDIMEQLTGAAKATPVADTSTDLPLTAPAPFVYHQGREFVVTGKFAMGKRSLVCDLIASAGGYVHERVRGSTDYLLVGAFASRDWISSVYGRKIEQAALLRAEGNPIAIVSEMHWRTALTPPAGTPTNT